MVRISFGRRTLSIRDDDDQKIDKQTPYQFKSNLVETLNILNEARGVDLISVGTDSIEAAVDCTVKTFKTTDSMIFLLKACALHTGWSDSDSALMRFQKRLREALG